MQRTVIRPGSKTGLYYLQHLYLLRHRPSISRLHSHVMADLTQGRMSNPLCNRQQLISWNFKNNILLCQKTRSCFFQVFPHRSQWNLETDIHMHIQSYSKFHRIHIHFRTYCGLNSTPTKVVSISIASYRCITFSVAHYALLQKNLL